MENIKLSDLMTIERLLLEINLKFKFDLSFNDVYMLNTYLTNVGKITNFFFLIQEEFYKKYNDADKLKEYHDKLMGDSVEFDCDGIIKFIERILNSYGDHNFYELVEKIKFW